LQWIDLEIAVNHIQHVIKDIKEDISPFFFLVGAGISHPPIPLASDIIEHCKVTARKYGKINPPSEKKSIDKYSYWFQQAYPQPIQRQNYLRNLIEGKAISAANFRLAHLMLEKTITNIVITTNFDDFLSQALTLFGKQHIVCDHPNTVERIDTEQKDIQIIHVHGTHWFYDCCNLQGEIEGRSQPSGHTTLTMAALLDRILSRHSPLVIGYSGWESDVIMTALQRRLQNPLPYNLYWFCYQRDDVDTLPDWLKYHQQVYFVGPSAKESSRQNVDELNEERKSAEKPIKEALSGDVKGFSGKKDDKSAFPAQKVFDMFIQKFDLKAPELTTDPLGFYAKYLRRTLLHDNPKKGESDIYFIGSVINRIEQAKEKEKVKPEKSKKKEKMINHKVEELRDAIRRSQYCKAIRLANVIDKSKLSSPQLSEILNAMWSAALEFNNNSIEEISSYDLIIEIADTLLKKTIDDPTLPERIAKALVNKGITLEKLNRDEDAISAYDEVVRRFDDSTETAIQEQVAKALVNKGITLEKLNRDEDAISAYDEVVRRFDGSTETAIQEQVAAVLFYKGIRLGELNRNKDAISTYDEIVRRFGDSNEIIMQASVAAALINKSFRLGELNRNEDAISAYDEIVKRFGDSTVPPMQELVAKALVNKGITLEKLNRNEDAISAYDEVVRRFDDSTETAIQGQVAKALVNKGVTLGELNRNEDAISAYDEVVRRFDDSTETAIQGQVAKALVNKGVTLGELNRNEDAISAYDEVVKRFGDSTETAIQEQVAKALRNIKNLRNMEM
jgi:tetratricopeptide (TPR) repeat protein